MTPFKTNQQLKNERMERMEKLNATTNAANIKQQLNPQDPILELKINQPIAQSAIPQTNQIYPSAYVPVPNPYYPIAPNAMIPWQYTPANVPIIKKYNISLGGPNGDITRIADLYEDILPSANNVIANTFNTIKERMIIHHYIRSIFIKTSDGEEIHINGTKNSTEIIKSTKSEITNLLSHVKLLEFNPYHFNRQTANNYKTMPRNFVMYRSCYPVKMGLFNNVECSKSSVGMNVRIYLLSKYDEEAKINAHLPRSNSDIWRELDYYGYIREEIMRPGLCPNFITMHSHYMTLNTGINFRKFDEIQSHIELRNAQIEKSNYDIRNNLYLAYIKKSYIDDSSFKVTFNDLIQCNLISNTETPRHITDEERNKYIGCYIDKLYKNNQLSHFMDSDKCLVILSEAPTQHLLNWATRTYQIDNGPIKKMIQNGYHDDKVWGSIIFQLLMAMLIMFEKKIMFKEFSLESNVYIKDLQNSDSNIGMWKYIYQGVEYYVPNYGYLVLIDSNFGELFTPLKPYDPKITNIVNSRIISPLFGDKDDQGQISKLCLERMMKIFNSDNFKSDFIPYGGIPPTNSFLSELDNIVGHKIREIYDKYFGSSLTSIWSSTLNKTLLKDIKNIPINLIKSKFFNMTHSRIGTPVKDTEKSYISDDFDINTKIGSIIIRKISTTFFTFGIYLGSNSLGGYNILTTAEPLFSYDDKSNTRFIELTIDIGSIANYYSQPEHIYEPGKQYTILETYTISLAE